MITAIRKKSKWVCCTKDLVYRELSKVELNTIYLQNKLTCKPNPECSSSRHDNDAVCCDVEEADHLLPQSQKIMIPPWSETKKNMYVLTYLKGFALTPYELFDQRIIAVPHNNKCLERHWWEELKTRSNMKFQVSSSITHCQWSKNEPCHLPCHACSRVSQVSFCFLAARPPVASCRPGPPVASCMLRIAFF